MAPVKAPSNLPELVRATFTKAKANGDLSYFPSEAAILTTNSIPFQIRYAPSLASKPRSAPAPPRDPLDPKPKVKPDPFSEPSPALKICDLEPPGSHFLVLNKFAVTPCHFILATVENKRQDHLLQEDDLLAATACIKAYAEFDKGKEGGVFVFYNSGQHSGASQQHRHLQLLPIAEMKRGLPSSDDQQATWDVLADSLPAGDSSSSSITADRGDVTVAEYTALPFRIFSSPINTAMSGAALRKVYVELYRRACRAVDEYAASRGFAVVAEMAHELEITDGAAWISYNLAITSSRMVIVPRMRQGADLMDAEGKSKVGAVEVNGTVLAGTALVKGQAEWEGMRREAEMKRVLGLIGVPRL